MRYGFRRGLPFVAALLALIPVTVSAGGERDREWLDCDRLHDSSVRHFSTAPTEWKATGQPIIVDSSPNGGVIVIGWDRDVVQVEAVLHARGRTKEAADALARKVELRMETGTITAKGPDDGAWSVTFIVHAPKRSDLELHAYNGPVEVEGVTGSMTLATRNGPISLEDVGGDVHARSVNGPLDVKLAGSAWDGIGLEAETQNGPVNLRIPGGYSARLTSGTRNGPVDIGIPVNMRTGRYFTTELGDGGTSLRVVTHNGPISIRRI